jgi:hypothetical protein
MSDTDVSKEQVKDVEDLSGGMQEKSTEELRKDNELTYAYNTRYDTIGGLKKSLGYTQQGSDLTSTTSTSTSSSTTTTSTSTSTSTTTSTSTSTSITSTSTTTTA